MKKDSWIAPVDAASPCGANLEYDSEFVALDQAVRGKAEQQYGDTVIPAEEPDWREVERIGTALMARTKDVRVAVPLLRAYVRGEALIGLADGLEALQMLLEHHWEQIHPQLVIDGDRDPFIRANSMAALADEMGLVRDVRQAVLIKSQIGSVLVKDAEAAFDGGHGGESPYSREQIIAIFADPQNAGNAGLQALVAAHRTCGAIMAISREKLGPDAPDLSALSDLLAPLARQFLAQTAPGEAPAGSGEGAQGGAPESGRTPAPHASAVTDIRSREEAIRALELACKFIERSEPSHPAPLLIRRAQHLMSLGFIDLVRELAPNGVAQVETIAGLRRD